MNREETSASRTRILYANRAPGEFQSIEQAFHAIASALSNDFEAQTLVAPLRGANLRSVLSNIRWAGSLPADGLVHITGDIHYAVLGVRRCPVVLTINDFRFLDESRGLRRLLFWFWWLALPVLRANRVTVISEFTKRRLVSLFPFAKKKVRVIPLGVDPEFRPLSRQWDMGRHRILHVGTGPNKNLSRMAEACQGLPVKLIILGRLEALQKMELIERGLEFEEFSGLSRGEVVALYQSCDLVCFVSTYEGFGLPIVEAQAVGRPVLTSDISPMREVAGEGALKVDPFDVAAIRSGLTRLIADAELRSNLVQEGFRNVEGYSAKSVALQYEELYRELLNAR